jgi:hypothetical protein
VKAGRVAWDRGLLRLLPVGVLNLGVVTLERPDIAVSLTALANPAVQDTGGTAKKQGFFFLPVADVAGTLNLVEGRCSVSGAAPGTFVAEQIEGGVTLASWRKPIFVQTRMQVGGGLLALEGRVQSIRDFYKGTESDEPEKVTLKLAGVELAAFRPLIQHAAGAPWIRGGRAEGALTAAILGKAHGTLEGGVMISRFSVEAPGQPPSPPGDVALMVDLGYDRNAVKVTKFEFSSPWLKAEASGALQAGQKAGVMTGAVTAKATVRLAAVARDFAAALGVSPEFRINGGEFVADIALDGGEEALRVQAKAVAAGLDMTAGGKPFTLKPEPSLEFKATFPYGAWPELEGLHLKAPFADVYASGRFNAAAVKVRLDLTRFSKDAQRILKTCPPMVGSAYLDVTTKQDGEAAALTSFLKLTDVAVELQPGQRMVVPQGTFKLSGRVPVKANVPRAELQDAAFEVALDGGKASGRWQRLALADGTQPLLVRGLSLASDMELSCARRLLGGVIPADVQRRMAAWRGRVVANATAEAAGGVVKARMNAAGVDVTAGLDGGVWRVPDVRMEGSLTQDGPASGLRVGLTAQGGGSFERDGAVVFAEPSARLAVDATFAADGETVRLANGLVATSLFTVEGAGDVTELRGRRKVAVQGKTTVDFAAVTRLLASAGIDEFELAGREARAFRFASPLAGGLSTVLAEGELAAAAHVGVCKGLGVSAGPADATFRLAGGVLKVAYEPELNGGRLRLVPEAAVGGRGGGALAFPPKTRLLENVAVTQGMVDSLLANMNPLFRGSTALGGTVTLTLRSCRVEQGVPPAQGVAVDMDILFRNLRLELGPSARDLLKMLNVKERVYEASQLPVHVVVRNGRIQADPVELVIERQPVIFSGWVAFDGAVRYQVEVPVTERLVGAPAYRALKGTSITIPVSGTVTEPRLDTGALQKMLGNALKNAVSGQAVEKANDFLNKLQRELQK